MHSPKYIRVTLMTVLILVAFIGPDSQLRARAQGSWATLAPMPDVRGYPAAAAGLDGRIYALGGVPPWGAGSREVNIYDPNTNTWSSAAPMADKLLFLAAATAPDGRIYVAGGLVGGAGYYSLPNRPEAYDPSTNLWTSIAPLPTARYYHAAVFGTDGRLYVIGGQTNPYNFHVTGSVEVYDPSTATWYAAAPMPTPRCAMAAAVGRDGRIYVMGGTKTSPSVDLNVLEAYDPATDTWTTLASMPTPRVDLAAATGSDGWIYAIGGFSFTSLQTLGTVEVYDPATNTWTMDSPMPTPRYGPGAATGRDGRIYVLGGVHLANQTYTMFSIVEAFTPVAAPAYGINKLYDETKAHRTGSTVPIKLQLMDANCANVSSSDITVRAVRVIQISANAPGLLEDSGAANPDFNFRYDPDLGGTGGYIFNLSLKGYATGTYAMCFTAGSGPTEYQVLFQVK